MANVWGGNKHEAGDNLMLRAIARTNRNTPIDDDAWLAIFDARSWTAATANKGQGGGFEDVT